MCALLAAALGACWLLIYTGNGYGPGERALAVADGGSDWTEEGDDGTRPSRDDPHRPPVHGRADKCARVAVNSALRPIEGPRPRVRVFVWGPAGFASGSTVGCCCNLLRTLWRRDVCACCFPRRTCSPACVPGFSFIFFSFSWFSSEICGSRRHVLTGHCGWECGRGVWELMVSQYVLGWFLD